MTNAQKQSIVNFTAQATGNLARLLPFPNDQFNNEVDRLINTLKAFRRAEHPTIAEDDETEDET